jgi:hypothetical protein
MASIRREQTSLKIFFWLALALNLAQFAAIVYSPSHTYRSSSNSGAPSGPGGLAIALGLFLLFSPVLLASLGILLANRYFPERELRSSGKVTLIALCILQILASIFMCVGSLGNLLADQPYTAGHSSISVLFLPPHLINTATCFAALWNLAAAIILWRTIRVIRKNARAAILRSFE